ncbi:unnamed protein product [Dicrocoelium dendriticum]|nr:unnamed protein product [Dicrocoelium dendriticum]
MLVPALCLLSALLSFNYANELRVITVATDDNDALARFLRSAERYLFDVKVLGLGTVWSGGDMAKFAGGGQKVRMLRNYLDTLDEKDDSLILFVDGYDVVFTDKKNRLLEEYHKLGSKILFGAEDFCWPLRNLEKLYPIVGPNEKRFLNSGAFIGPVSYIRKLVSMADIADEDDDQLYYTNIFLNEVARKELDIALDKSSALFQNLNGALSEVELLFNETTGYLHNTKTNTNPIVIHGNGPSKNQLNALANYLAHQWTPTRGCQHCSENNIELGDPKDYPIIQMSLFIEQATPFLDVFFERIAALSYPKDRIHLTGHVAKKAEIQRPLTHTFNATYGHQYRTSVWFDPEDITDDGAAYDRAFSYCLAVEDCQFLFVVDSTVQLTATDTLEHLVRMNRSMIAPMLSRREKLWSNFWGALSQNGYYERSNDYIDIVEGKQRGIWHVPFIRDVYLVSRWAMRLLAETKLEGSTEMDMEIAQRAREKNIFMTVDNQKPFGYLIFADKYTTNHVNNDLWQIFDNHLDWEEQYVHPEYSRLLDPNVGMEDILQPCPDVFWFPLVSEKFSAQLINESESANMWSDGSNQDPRLEGGYENVPTRDIHMRQLEWEEHWLHFLQKYVHPIQKKVFQGYDDKPWARMNFVVRYKPDEQASLRPHHDASSYSLTIALNQPGVDYEGGGTRFVRYNCSVVNTKIGWTTIFPGRVTHLHEGLTTTAGTRYIFVTFVNP